MDADNNGSYKRWSNCEWWEEGYERLWTDDPPSGSNSEAAEAEPESQEAVKRSRSEKDAVIYLTADADDELEELREGETYILGGIVDHNRYKVRIDILISNKPTHHFLLVLMPKESSCFGRPYCPSSHREIPR